MDQMYPQLTKQITLSLEPFNADNVAALKPDVAMLCVPHKIAMNYVPQLRAKGIRVIDWSADYRFKDQATYETWYSAHSDAAGLGQAVYGLPEFFADQIRTASLVANPGCYVTAATLALAPIINAGLIETRGIVVSSVSGISGAGRTPSQKNHYPERNENFEPYGVGEHRHMPEIEQNLKMITGRDVSLLFQPHLCPMDRGIMSSIYARPVRAVTTDELTAVLEKTYANKPFVRVRKDVLPATKYVAYTNFCDIAARSAKGLVVVFSAIDNMVKGASGQAIQSMNLMFGLDETAGLAFGGMTP